ncbi:MAG TPA: glycoside hydrolase family 3 N-terminal domain-containing protein [Solirubrobacterales bacterium]|nr:glycoside hydrolase family 3 N-terminal domain-containing protein [Solirubrobacterales bacterium]
MFGGKFSLGEPGSQVRVNRVKVAGIGGALVCLALILGAVVGSSTNADTSGDRGAEISALADGLSDHELAGQRFVAGFSGTTVPAATRKAIRSGRIGGIILFADNLPDRATARAITRQLQRIKRPRRLRAYSLPIMIDQEGGLVKRLAGAPDVSAETMGARGPSFSRTQGKRTARNLRNAGVNIDLAPVLDVARPGGNIAETDRGFGGTAKRVSATAIPFAKGLQANGVAATAKHFPGLGAVSLNTDDAVQRIDLSKRVIRKVDEAPYRPFVEAGGELVMVGTAIYPAFSERPAAFEKKIVIGELRDRLGFEGVTITDSLEAVAAQDFGSSARVSIAGAKAGMDILLFGTLREALKGEDAVAKRLRAGKLDRDDFEESVGRILRLRDKLPG